LSTCELAIGGDRCRFEADSTLGAVAAWLSQIAQCDSEPAAGPDARSSSNAGAQESAAEALARV
jgi:hypothetical protein